MQPAQAENSNPMTIGRTAKLVAITTPLFFTGIVCVILVGSGWLSDPLAATDQTADLSRFLAGSCLAAAAMAVIVAIYFTFRALTVREPPKNPI